MLVLVPVVLWASFYVAGQFALDVLPPFAITAVRFTLVAMMLLPFFGWTDLPFRRLFILSILLGVCNFALGLAGFGWGIELGSAIVLAQLGVPFSCVFGAVMLNDKLGAWRSFGLLVAMLGAMLLASNPNVMEHYGAFLALIAASLGWGLANILMKSYGTVRIFPFLGSVAVLIAVETALISLVAEPGAFLKVANLGVKGWGSMIYLSLFTVIIAYGTWYYVLSKYNASQVTPISMLGPFVAFTLGYYILDMVITLQMVASGLITLVGVSIIVMRRPRLAFLGKVVKTDLSERQDGPFE